MEFYQLKIIRKGTKPPVWRRCLVPSNITFAQQSWKKSLSIHLLTDMNLNFIRKRFM